MNTNPTAPGATTSLVLADDPGLMGTAFMDVRVSDAGRVAAGQELSRVRRKLRVAHGDR